MPEVPGSMNQADDPGAREIILANGDTALYVMDSPIVRAMDSALYMKFNERHYFYVDTAGSSAYHFAPGEVPTFPDSIYKQRIEALNCETSIELTYN